MDISISDLVGSSFVKSSNETSFQILNCGPVFEKEEQCIFMYFGNIQRLFANEAHNYIYIRSCVIVLGSPFIWINAWVFPIYWWMHWCCETSRIHCKKHCFMDICSTSIYVQLRVVYTLGHCTAVCLKWAHRPTSSRWLQMSWTI